MALWVDKHRPRELSKLDFHQRQAEKLKNLCQQSDFPHLMFYGPPGAGKKTRIMCLLRELYGVGVERLRNEVVSFKTPSNRKVEILTISSNYHIEVNPSDAGINDRVVIIDLIKHAAQTQVLDIAGQRDFKVIVLTEVDKLTIDAQHALRRTMEKYIATCRIIFSVLSPSRVIPAIRSRCFKIRVASPQESDVISILKNTCKRENLTVPEDLAKVVSQKSERNLRRAILMLESARTEQYPFTVKQNVPNLDWQIYLANTSKLILQEQMPAKLEEVRERLYELLVQGIPADNILCSLVQQISLHKPFPIRAKAFEYAALYEHRMQHGAKQIFHLEAFVAQFMNLCKEHSTTD